MSFGEFKVFLWDAEYLLKILGEVGRFSYSSAGFHRMMEKSDFFTPETAPGLLLLQRRGVDYPLANGDDLARLQIIIEQQIGS